MRKKSKPRSSRKNDDLEIPPVTRESLRRGVMGKYYARVMARSNVVRIASDLSAAFPNEVAVNQALREVLRFRETLKTITSDKAKRRKTA